MAKFDITIFVSPPPVAKVAGRYICLIEGESGDPETYLADDSLVNLARELGDKVDDWAFVENALIENGIFRLSDVS
jgi:hypothetical protein